jgi:hypothetical protein
VTLLRRISAGRTILGLAAVAALLAAVAGCAAPSYTYVVDSGDGAYFKVPAAWPQLSAGSVADVESELSGSPAGATGGSLTWSRAFSAQVNLDPGEVLVGSDQPVVYASVQDMSSSLRSELSFSNMQDLLLPVTSQARSAATKDGSKLTGFRLITSGTVSGKDGVRGINELFEYTVNGQPDAFDQTVLTNGATTKLYLLLVQCYQACFAAHQAQIAAVVNSFTVQGS